MKSRPNSNRITALLAVLLGAILAWQTGIITMPASAAGKPYVSIGGGKFKLTRNVHFNTRRFGRITLTKGFVSDGSSSPIPDGHATRMAGFLHDAMYTVSGHLRFQGPFPRRWSKKQADKAYCQLMADYGASKAHQRTNCVGAKWGLMTKLAWNHYAGKRKKRWAHRARRR